MSKPRRNPINQTIAFCFFAAALAVVVGALFNNIAIAMSAFIWAVFFYVLAISRHTRHDHGGRHV